MNGLADFEKREWAVESANGLGYLVAQQLVAGGEAVFDVPPVLASRVRVLGSGRSQKNDPNDARSVAIAALRSDRLALVCADDHDRVLRLLAKRHRDMARFRNKHCTRLHALLLELQAGGIGSEITVNKANKLLDQLTVGDEVTRYRVRSYGNARRRADKTCPGSSPWAARYGTFWWPPRLARRSRLNSELNF